MEKKDRDQRLKIIRQDYEDFGLEETCEQLISIVLPSLERIRSEMEREFGRPVVQYITSRVKQPDSIMYKLIRKRRSVTLDRAIDTFHDLAGIRVVCSFQDDVYRVVKQIKKIPALRVEKVKDYIAHPKPTGYRGIHIISEIPESGQSIRLEIQVYSAAMNYWAMLNHQLGYKNSKGNEKEFEKIKKKLKTYAVQISDIDKQFLKIRRRIENL